MIQDDNPALADICEEGSAPESDPTLPPASVDPKPTQRLDAAAPDMFVVGVRVLKMAPAWLLAMTVGCSTLVLLLGWMNAGMATAAVAQPSSLNDARSSRVAPAKTAPVRAPEASAPVKAPDSATAAADNKPAPAPAQAVAPAPATPAIEKSEAPAAGDEATAKFTVQVSSFNSESEANERVSSLRAAGFDSRAVAVEIQGRTWYRVQVGRFADRGEGAKTLASVRAKGAAGAIIVPLQN